MQNGAADRVASSIHCNQLRPLMLIVMTLSDFKMRLIFTSVRCVRLFCDCNEIMSVLAIMAPDKQICQPSDS